MTRLHARPATGMVVLLAAVLFSAGVLAGWCSAHAVRSGEAEDGTGVLAVSTDLGDDEGASPTISAFAAGLADDGSAVSEHVVLEGGGPVETAVPCGTYELVCQPVRIMRADGRVLSSIGPEWARVETAGEKARVELSYTPADMSLLADEELAEIAADSFADEGSAAEALERAQTLRDAAPAPDLATPDIDGETPGDVPGPATVEGGE